MTTLSEIPTSRIPMPHRPLLGSTDEETRDLWKGRTEVARHIVAEMARITGWFGSHLPSTYPKQAYAKSVVQGTTCKFAVALDSWKTKDGWIPSHDKDGCGEHLYDIADWLDDWERIGCKPDLVLITDESEEITADNERAVWLRTANLCAMLEGKGLPFIWYNARMVRAHDAYPFTHPLVPGPSSVSIYHLSDDINRDYWKRTADVLKPWPWASEVVPSIEFHRYRADDHTYATDIGHLPKHFIRLAKLVKEMDAQRVLFSEMPMLKGGHEYGKIVANLATFVEETER